MMTVSRGQGAMAEYMELAPAAPKATRDRFLADWGRAEQQGPRVWSHADMDGIFDEATNGDRGAQLLIKAFTLHDLWLSRNTAAATGRAFVSRSNPHANGQTPIEDPTVAINMLDDSIRNIEGSLAVAQLMATDPIEY